MADSRKVSGLVSNRNFSLETNCHTEKQIARKRQLTRVRKRARQSLVSKNPCFQGGLLNVKHLPGCEMGEKRWVQL